MGFDFLSIFFYKWLFVLILFFFYWWMKSLWSWQLSPSVVPFPEGVTLTWQCWEPCRCQNTETWPTGWSQWVHLQSHALLQSQAVESIKPCACGKTDILFLVSVFFFWYVFAFFFGEKQIEFTKALHLSCFCGFRLHASIFAEHWAVNIQDFSL